MINPKCPKCNKNLRLSKIQEDTWICKNCNEVFDTPSINIKGTWYERRNRHSILMQQLDRGK